MSDNKKYNGSQSGYTNKTFTWTEQKGVKHSNKQKFWVTAWNTSSERGLIKLEAIENSRSKRYVSHKEGKKHIMMFAEVFFTRTGNKHVEYIDFCLDSQTATLPKLGMFLDVNMDRFTNLVNPKNKKKRSNKRSN